MGGWTEDNVYSWGGSPVSYLRPVNDVAWDRASDNPSALRSWTQGFTRRQVAPALGFTTDHERLRRPAGRPAASGRGAGDRRERGGQVVTGLVRGVHVRNALGLLSPGFVVMNNP